MLGIEKMSQNLITIQSSGLAHYSGKLSEFFFSMLLASLDFSVGSPGGTTHIQTILDVCPRVSKNVMGYCSHSVPFPGFQTLKIVDFDLVDEVRTHPLSHDTPQIYQLNLHTHTYIYILLYT